MEIAFGPRSKRNNCFCTPNLLRPTTAAVREILLSIREMPSTMQELAWVQIATWLGLFCMWLYFPAAVARNVFGASDTNSPLYSAGVEWAGVCFGMYSLVCFGFSFLPPWLLAASSSCWRQC
jgi:maltose/moltooligosaccharide transporter